MRTVRDAADPAAPVPVAPDAESWYQDPLGLLARLRESRPVAEALLPGAGHVWVITRYAGVRAALTDPRLVTTLSGRKDGVHALLNIDPPDHTRLRRALQQAFTPRRAERLRPRAAQIAAELLDALPAGGVTDLLAGYARPLPVTVISELLGVPAADRDFLGAAVISYGLDGGDPGRAPRELGRYFAELIAARRAGPGDDLLSALARDGGALSTGQLSTGELICAAYHLIMAGFDTTVNLIASGTLALLTHPEQLSRLRREPGLLSAAVEELLRFTSPVNHVTLRYAREDVRIGGAVIPAGARVLIATSSANRDSGRFPGAGRLDLSRDAGGHAAFGHGIHYCLGAPLARMEAEVAFAALLRRFPDLSLAVAPDQLRWRPVSLMNGLEQLPVRLG